MSAEVAHSGPSRPAFHAAASATVEDVFFANLVLLGMEIENSEKKYGCIIAKDMFHAPNVRGMEAILYFLLGKVSAEARDVRYKFFDIL